MAQTTYSGEFKMIKVDNAAGTPVELSDYLINCTVHAVYDDRDGSTSKAGGGPVAETHGRGALAFTIQCKWRYTKQLARHLRQIFGSRNGFTVRCYNGANASPTYGDEIAEGEMTWLQCPIPVTPGQNVELDTLFVLADGAPTPTYPGVF
jgi:hypothetical protein